MDLRIGIENELFFQGPDEDPPQWPSEEDVKLYAEKKLVPFYNKKRGRDLLRSGFIHNCHPGHNKDHTDNDKWAVTTDVTMFDFNRNKSGRNVEGGALEFVSPILSFCSDGAWKEEVKTHWATLLDIGTVQVNTSCATHVHISRKAKSGPKKELNWTMTELRNIAQAVLYFDKAFDAILAPSRRGASGFNRTRSNKANNQKLRNLGFEECCELLQIADLNRLVSLMQPLESAQSDDTKYERFYGWNFENTKEGDVDGNIDGKKRIGTIEFRGAPGVLTAGHCLIWVVLAVYFVQAAAQFGTKEILEEANGSSHDDLRQFILRAVPNKSDIDILNIPFSHPGLDTDEKMRVAFDEDLRRLGH